MTVAPRVSKPLLFLIFGIVVAALCLLSSLESYPLYLFCDEALHVVEAQKLLDTGADRFGKPWPIFLEAFGNHELSLSVYLQLPFNYFFGFDAISARVRSTFCTLVLGVILAFLTREMTRLRVWWLWPIALVSSSFWYLHSRTGFQLTLAGLCYGVFVVAYLCWRERTSKWQCLALASVAAALGCYTYTATRGWVFCTVFLFLLLDGRLLLRAWKDVLKGLLPGIICMIPFVAVMIAHPDWLLARYYGLAGSTQLAANSKPWTENTYNLLSWGFWFGTNHQLDFDGGERHRVAGLAYFPVAFGFFFAVGGIIALLKKSIFPRAHIAAIALAGVFPAVTLEVNPLRCLPVWFAILILIVEGTNWLLERCVSCKPSLAGFFEIVVVSSYSLVTVYQHVWAVLMSVNYVSDFGPRGMQIGARELGTWIRENSIAPSKIRLGMDMYLQPHITTAVAAGTDFSGYAFMSLGSLCAADADEAALRDRTTYWVTRSRGDKFIKPGCPIRPVVKKVISTPNGTPYLYVYTLEVGANLTEFLTEKKEERRLLRQSAAAIGKIPVKILHNELNLGSVAQLFDGNQSSLIRTNGVNPAVLKFDVPPELRKHSWSLSVSHSLQSVVSVMPAGEKPRPCTFERNISKDPPVVNFLCDISDVDAQTLTFIVDLPWVGADSPVHISELAPVKAQSGGE